MKSIKKLLSFVIPLTAMLISFSIYLVTNKVVESYSYKISNDYSIVIVTSTPLIKEKYTTLAGIDVSNIKTLQKEKIINNVKNNLSKDSVELLRQKLPYFYQIHLESFPTTLQLEVIKKELTKIENIKKIEVFSKNHNKTYLLLSIINKIIIVLFAVILIFAIIILSKQVRIWFYENNDKISIMKLHGASILYSASSIIRYAIYSAIVSFLIVSGIFVSLINNISIIFPEELKDVLTINVSIEYELAKIFLLSMLISVLTIFGVLFTHKIKND